MSRLFWILAAAVLCGFAALAQQAAPPPANALTKPETKPDLAAVALAPGDGEPLVAKACVQCHTLARITTHKYTRPGWQQVISEMLDNGAELDDAAVASAVDYLVAHYGRSVNVNQASAADLAAALAFTPEQAAAVVAYREKNGNFQQWQDLEKVPGLDEKTVTALHEAFVF